MYNSDQSMKDQDLPPDNQEDLSGEIAEDPDLSPASAEDYSGVEDEQLDFETKFKEMQHRFLCLTADFENFRRRSRQESGEIRRTANERLLREIIPIIDNFERALDVAKKDLPENIIIGIEMIYRQFCNLLSQEGVEAIESVGKPFDPVYQDAFERIETTEYPEGVVTAEVQKGYLLQDKVLRPALVIVAEKPKSEKDEYEKFSSEGVDVDE